MAFKDSLKSGHKFEDEIIEGIQQLYTARRTERGVVTSKGDVYLSPIPGTENPFKEDGEFLVEMKQDCKVWVHGFTAHEIFKVVDKKEVPAGLSATEADWYVIGYSTRPDVWAIKTEKLIELVEQGQYHDIVHGTGDGKRSTIVRFVPDELHKHATFLFSRVIRNKKASDYYNG